RRSMMSSTISSKLRTLVAYVASPHAGYLKLFRAYEGGDLWILGPDLVGEHTSLVRHIPAVGPYEARLMIKALGIFKNVRVLHREDVPYLPAAVALPDEDVSHAFASKYLGKHTVHFDAG